MLVVSAREFRANQGKYLDLAVHGEDVVLKSTGKGIFKLVPVSTDDTLISKEDFCAKIEHSLKQARKGKVIKQNDQESVEQYIERLLCTD